MATDWKSVKKTGKEWPERRLKVERGDFRVSGLGFKAVLEDESVCGGIKRKALERRQATSKPEHLRFLMLQFEICI